MKKIIVTVLVIAFGVTLHAQDIPQRKQENKNSYSQHRKMKGKQNPDFQKLNLTDAQKAQMKEIRESMHKQMDELKKNDNITVKDWKSKREAIQKNNKEKMMALLTPDQKTKLEDMKAEKKVDRQEMMKKRGDMMMERLNLTADQSAKMEKSRADAMAKTKMIRENNSLNDDQKKEQIKELHKKQQEDMKSILTDEQLKKLKESKHQRPDGQKAKPSVSK